MSNSHDAFLALEMLKSQVEINLSEPISNETVPLECKKKFTPPNIKSRCWVMLLYPDNEDHVKIHDVIYDKFVCIGALHDSDLNAKGQKVKDHWHIVFYFPSAVYASHILNEFPDLEPRFCLPRKDVKTQARYLLHLDSPSKHQYKYQYLEGHIDAFQKYIDKESSESKQVIALIDAIESGMFSCLADLIRYACDNSLYGTYRRNAWSFNTILSQNIEKRKGD